MNPAFDPSKKTRLVVAGVTLLSAASARAADLATTLHFNPTLSREANPLVSALGFDATQLIITNAICLLLFVLAPLSIYALYAAARMEERPQTLAEYISLQLYRCRMEKRDLFRAIFLGSPLPKDWLQVTRAFGFVISWTVVFGSLQATFGWWATNQWEMEWYRIFRSVLNFRGYPVMEVITVLIFVDIVGYLFFRMEFKQHKLQTSNAEQGGGGQPATRSEST